MTSTTTTPLPKLVSTTATSPFRPSANSQHRHPVLPNQTVHRPNQQQSLPQLSQPAQHIHQLQQQQHSNPPSNLSSTPRSENASPPKPQPVQSSRPPPSQTDPVLPRGARVRITGNNRTKWDLIGRVGQVRAAQTLGGWHEVQLNDGGIVRVQRNALAVLELPPLDPSSLVRIESANRDNHVPLASTGVKKRVKKPPRPSHANISKLNFASLKRYRNVYNLNVSNHCSRDELVGAVRKHFERTKVNESEVISNFLRHIARRGGPPASD